MRHPPLEKPSMVMAGSQAVRPLCAAAPALGVEPLVARLREQRPDLDAGAEQVGEALRAPQV